jgi:hypothetical protein
LTVCVVIALRASKDASRKLHTFAVPHFPHDDAISPQDIQGKRAYGSATEAETLEAVRARKMERIRQNHAWTLEFARAQAITAGTVYAPNGTVTQNWNTEFGVTRLSVDFTLGTSTVEPLARSNRASRRFKTTPSVNRHWHRGPVLA